MIRHVFLKILFHNTELNKSLIKPVILGLMNYWIIWQGFKSIILVCQRVKSNVKVNTRKLNVFTLIDSINLQLLPTSFANIWDQL